MAAKHESNGDILMLEAPPSAPPGPTWPGLSRAEVIDALPYIDADYGDARVKEEVDRLVEDEMRRSSKKPADFLKDLPPLPSFTFQVTLAPTLPCLIVSVEYRNVISTSL